MAGVRLLLCLMQAPVQIPTHPILPRACPTRQGPHPHPSVPPPPPSSTLYTASQAANELVSGW